MIKNSSPINDYAAYLLVEDFLKDLTVGVILATAITTVVLLLLSPILIPLWLLEKVFNGVKATWDWFFPKPEPEVDPMLAKVRAQFKKARRK